MHFLATRHVIYTACLLLCTTAYAQEGYKNPSTATLLSVVAPGGGQLYAGETAKGALLLVGSVGAVAVGTARFIAVSDKEAYFGCPEPCWEPNYTPFLIGAGIGGALWLYGVIDASGAAKRTNRKRGFTSAVRVAPTRHMLVGARQSGLALRVTF